MHLRGFLHNGEGCLSGVLFYVEVGGISPPTTFDENWCFQLVFCFYILLIIPQEKVFKCCMVNVFANLGNVINNWLLFCWFLFTQMQRQELCLLFSLGRLYRAEELAEPMNYPKWI